jgi:hypothetical protein
MTVRVMPVMSSYGGGGFAMWVFIQPTKKDPRSFSGDIYGQQPSVYPILNPLPTVNPGPMATWSTA